jgi:hypothetical protein
MGHLTTITIHNDSANQIKSHSTELSDKISAALCGEQLQYGNKYESLGNDCNALILQKPRHMDDHTLYLHAGNTVTDVFDVSSEWEVDTFISEMTYHLKRLKEIKKRMKL